MKPPPDVCGPLDVGDQLAYIPTTPVPRADVAVAVDAGTRSPAYDGPPSPSDGSDEPGVAFGRHTVVKAQHREHERLASARWFDSLRTDLALPGPELLDHGEVDTPSGPRWWLVLRRVRGQEAATPTPARLHALGQALRAWHEGAPHHGLRLDSPGGVGVQLGSMRARHPRMQEHAAALLDDACRGMPVTAVHGDAAVGHNTLYDGERLVALIDPGAVHVAPPMLELAWCLAIDEPRGGAAAPLLDGYGRDAVDLDALEALLPHMYLRRLVDAETLGLDATSRWLRQRLNITAPRLLSLLVR